jgi:hypothetical protein
MLTRDGHVMASCIWEYELPLTPHNNAGEATFFGKSDAALDTPDLQTGQVEVSLQRRISRSIQHAAGLLDAVARRCTADQPWTNSSDWAGSSRLTSY